MNTGAIHISVTFVTSNFTHMYRSILLSAAITLFNPCEAQLFFDGSIPVQRNGVDLQLAWAGGLNFVQVSTIDLNGDDLDDVFLFDRSGNKVITLLNNGAGGIDPYTVTRAYDQVYPLNELHDWVLLRDFNCDGKKDIFTYSQAGFSVFKNTGSGGQLSFELTKFRVNSDYITSTGSSVIANLYISLVDIPAIDDVDGDGDMDVLTFSLLGSYMEYHKNLSMELYGTCDSLVYEVRNKCWGSFSENFSNNAVTLNDPCMNNVPNPEMPTDPGRPEYVEFTEEPRAHAGSSILSLDLDGNSLVDLVLGDIAHNNLVALFNNGSAQLAEMTAQDTLFPVYDQPVDLPLFPAAFYEDMNNDGIRDLIVSPNAGSLAQNFQSMWYFQNIGEDLDPTFDLQMENLFQGQMLEFGEGSLPVLFDHDSDGLMDLIVANHGYFQIGNTYQARFALLKNIGTANAPAFDLIDEDYMNLSASGIGTAMYPAFGDVDGDGDKDMYIGDLNGRIHFFRNDPVGGVAQFQLQTANLPDAGGSPIDVGQFATPIFHDLDQDGLIDLIIGERNGNLNYYRNTGTSTSPQWTQTGEDLGSVSTVEWWNVTGHAVPFMFENASGDREMILGSESGWIYHYGGIEGNINGAWTLLDSTYLDLFEGSRTGPVLYDFTGDGELDLVIGNYRGGLSFWRSDDNTSISDRNVPIGSEFSIQPNPATDLVELLLMDDRDASGTWIIRDAIGREVLRSRSQGKRTTISMEGSPAGIYFVNYEGPVSAKAQKLMVIGK